MLMNLPLVVQTETAGLRAPAGRKSTLLAEAHLVDHFPIKVSPAFKIMVL